MVENQVAMFLFGVASAHGSMLLWIYLPAWLQDRRRRKRIARGRSYWDAILAEDRRRQARGEPVFFMHEQEEGMQS